MTLNIIKVCVGADSIEDLHEWQASRLFDYNGEPAAMTRTLRRPREHEAVAAGGSLYWVIKRHIAVRQAILGFEPIDASASAWKIVVSPLLTRTMAVPRKPFQGWRYLLGDQAPPDGSRFVYGEREDNASPEMREALLEAGLF